MKALIWPLLVFWSVSAPLIAAEFPAIPGQRFDIGGYQLHIHCMGSGSPTVIVDVGLGDDSTYWLPIQKAVSSSARICVFDRPGYGWSDFGPSPVPVIELLKSWKSCLYKPKFRPPTFWLVILLVGITSGFLQQTILRW